MEVSTITAAQSRSRIVDLSRYNARSGSRSAKIVPPANVSFSRRFRLNAVQSRIIEVEEKEKACISRSKRVNRAGLYVGLPLDAVSGGKMNHIKAISAGLKALKLLGIDGVELPVWWSVVEDKGIGQYDWSGYLDIAQIVKEMDLDLHISLCFHGCEQAGIPLPRWIGEADSSVFFSDKAGKQYKECLSFSADDLPVLNGKTPMETYQAFCESFKDSFSDFLGSTITGISIGVGPEGEIRYPGGEFQCYDKNSLRLLKNHAEAMGKPLWGLGGPHDAPVHNESPLTNNFSKEFGGSWETPYGHFFLSWYSGLLLSHLNRVLSIGSTVFSGSGSKVFGRLPLVDAWYKTRSHAAELSAGFYNVDGRDGYDPVAEIFSRNSCGVVLSGMDRGVEPVENRSELELLASQIKAACGRHGVDVSGSSFGSGQDESAVQLDRVRRSMEEVGWFVYGRMGAYFFSPEHFPKFTEFVRSLSMPELDSDDLPAAVGGLAGESCCSGESLELQVA